MKRSRKENTVVDLSGDDSDCIFSAADANKSDKKQDETKIAAVTDGVVTKVKTRWLNSGRNEGALMTLNLRELRDEAKRLGFEVSYSKVDTKDKYVTYLHKVYSGGNTAKVLSDNEGHDVVIPSPSGAPDSKKKRRHSVICIQEEPEPVTPKPDTKTKKSAKKSSDDSVIQAAIEAAFTKVLGGKLKEAAEKKTKKKGQVKEKLSDEEKKLLEKLDEFFGAKDRDSSYGRKKEKLCGLPQSEWSYVVDIDQLPFIEIDKSTILSFPCNEILCKKLIEEHCEQAPFGMGDKTVLDKNVRSSWQIDGSKVNITSKTWNNMFSNSKISTVLEEIRKQMTPDCKKISAKLYKMLVYEKGSFFTPHRDTQREDKHFGSIVVFLPSMYAGGELLVRHLDRERNFQFSYTNDEAKEKHLKAHAVAFFSDCEHEVKPVLSGYRVCLTYNLFFESGSNEPEPPKISLSDSEKKLGEILAQLFALKSWRGTDKKLGMIMQHQYALNSLSKPECLKGEDKMIYNAFLSSGKYQIELVPISVFAEGSCGDDEACEKAVVYYHECIKEEYETKFIIRKRDINKALEREEAKENDDDYYEEDDEDYFDDIQGELLSEFTWNFNGYSGGESTYKGPVRFVGDFRKAAIGKVCMEGTQPTGNEGTEFGLQYQAAAMLISMK